jgi:urocanate hydratase
LEWIKGAQSFNLVVGSQARILYSDQAGRVSIAREMNRMVREGILKGPVVISRDHHDVSGTDSPFRETSNIYDGSAFTADMAVQNFIGDGIRGATWVSLHNGGGVGWGEGKFVFKFFDFLKTKKFNFFFVSYEWWIWSCLGW